jgi:hypothetical protein
MVSDVLGQWENQINAVHDNLFNGSAASLSTLNGIMAEGQFAKINSPDKLDTIGLVSNALFSLLIPANWQLNGQFPLVLESGMTCGTPPPPQSESFIDANLANQTSICFNNLIYYLVGVGTAGAVPCLEDDACTNGIYVGLPGFSTLDGNTWGTLSAIDFAARLVHRLENGITPWLVKCH